MPHDPVLLEETLAFLGPRPGLFLDATVGDGGHAEAMLLAADGLRLLANDRDPDALAFSRARLARFGARVTFVHGTFRELSEAHKGLGSEPLAGALFDLGLSSRQIDEPARGMSYRNDGPLDLRMDASRGETLAERMESVGEEELARVLVAAHREGALAGTRQLATIVARVLRDDRPAAVAPVFQALRIWVNDEMADLESALDWLPEAMADGGVVVTLSYHSGEDRRVKRALRGSARTASRRLPPPAGGAFPGGDPGPWEELTRKVVVPAEPEQRRNPRARSARLRAFRREPK